MQFVKVNNVLYDEDEDYYLVSSYNTAKLQYRVNKLKDSRYWFCECRSYQYSKEKVKTCKHVKRIKVVDQMRVKGLLEEKW